MLEPCFQTKLPARGRARCGGRPGRRPRARGDAAPSTDAPTSAETAPTLPLDLKGAVAEYEINLLKQAMQQSQYNQRKAAQLLALSYHQFRGMLRKYQLLDGDDNSGNQEAG